MKAALCVYKILYKKRDCLVVSRWSSSTVWWFLIQDTWRQKGLLTMYIEPVLYTYILK